MPPDRSRLFGLDDLDAAADFAETRNNAGCSVYVGAALRNPDADRSRRCSGADFYVAAFAAFDVDEDLGAVSKRVADASLKPAFAVRTGSTPANRFQVWLPLRVPCDDPDELGEALGALVAHVGADPKVHDSARVLRLAGTVARGSLDPRKAARGYVDEVTSFTPREGEPVDLLRLAALAPMPGREAGSTGGHNRGGGSGEVVRDANGIVTDGRETWFRTLLLKHLARTQRQHGADPTADELFADAYTEFGQTTENSDERWTSSRGQAALRKRTVNTLRRLRAGHLARCGLYSYETATGREEAEAVQAERDRKFSERAAGNNTPDTFDTTHDALAVALGADGWDLDARYVATWGKWLFWDGTRWQIDEKLAHMTQTRAFLRRRGASLTEWCERKASKSENAKEADTLRARIKSQVAGLANNKTVMAVASLARSNPESVARAESFDGDRLLLGTPGGTVDLRSGQLRPARRADMITRLTGCAPARGTPVRWLRFLSEVFDSDEELVAFTQRVAGYALTGATSEHKLFFAYGTGRNGKSVFLNTLFDIWGDYARRASSATFLNSHGDRHPTDLAGLQGARLVAASELPKGKTWDESVIKDLTGGDVITARYMRGDFFDFEPQMTLFIAGNNMPSFRGVDEAIRARMVLLPFTVTIPPEQRDKDLPAKLKAEAPQILQWAIDGAVQWRAAGLQVPASVEAASAEYLDDEDTVGQFLADETIVDPAAFTKTTDLHIRFGQWCDLQGLNTWTLRTLQKEIKQRGYQEHRRNSGRGFIGLRLASP
ncbi:phage/plasmid primase, P4 family [Tropicimonas aquimaris]|uniref:Phage/plasmid primase, P4 family n=1 Tax=Tropicimonas aquimaris TaxID=914152 RepID=A0ABW3IRG8_9RHOB